MAKPNAPKEMKPKEAETDNSKSGGSKVLIINVVTTAIICSMFLVANYFIQDFLFSKKMVAQQTETEGTVEEQATAEERGIIVDLGEFTVNLSDPDNRRYLKTSVAIEVSKIPSDEAPAKKSGGHGGHGGGEPAVSPIEAEMAQYKPAIRDAIISALSSKTSSELSTTAGKELSKDEIIDSVDSIFGGEREVIRVSFAQFIMQ